MSLRRRQPASEELPAPSLTPGIADTFGRKASLALVVSSLGFLLGFISSVVVARLLGAAGKGTFSLFIATVSGISMFAGLGIGHGQMYHAARSREKLRHFLSNGLLVSIVFGGGAALLYFIAGQFWNLRGAALGRAGLFAGLFLVPIVTALKFQKQYLITTHHFALSRSNVAFTQALPMLAVLALYPFTSVTVEKLIIAVTVGMLCCLILYHGLTKVVREKEVTFSPRLISLSFARESVSFGIRQYLSDLTLFLVNRADFFLIAWFLDHRALGIYSVAVSLAEVVSRLPREVGVLLFPVFAAEGLRKGQAPSVLRRTLLFAIALTVPLAILAGPVIEFLYGDEFREAVIVFRWLLIGTIAWSTIQVTWNRVSAGGRPGLGVPLFGVAALLDVGLNVVLLPRIGVVGAAIAATVSYWLAALLFLRLFCRRESCSYRDAIVFRREDISSLFRLCRSLMSRSHS